MKRICAWCRSEISSTSNDPQSDTDDISHGICGHCADNIMFQQGVALPVYLESLNQPVLLVNSRGAVQAANASARKTFARGFYESADQPLTGDVFECQYARLPEGCGRTIHCSGCAIRRAIEITLETGEPQSMIPATLRRSDPDHPTAIALFITTVKAGDLVLLKLEYRNKNTPSGRK